jgi:hypothetical protein
MNKQDLLNQLENEIEFRIEQIRSARHGFQFVMLAVQIKYLGIIIDDINDLFDNAEFNFTDADYNDLIGHIEDLSDDIDNYTYEFYDLIDHETPIIKEIARSKK